MFPYSWLVIGVRYVLARQASRLCQGLTTWVANPAGLGQRRQPVGSLPGSVGLWAELDWRFLPKSEYGVVGAVCVD